MQEVVVDQYGNLKDGIETVMVYGVALPSGLHPKANIARANTALLADAINTERKTGLTPRKLAEQRAELLGALKRFTSYGDVFAYRPHEGNPYDHAVELIAKCEAAQ